MIRTHSGHAAFSDLHDYFLSRRDEFLAWWNSATRAAEGVALSQAAILAIEEAAGRSLRREEMLATAWIMNVCIDIERKLRDKESRTLTKLAYDDAIAVVKTNAVEEFTGLPTHAAAQVSVIISHLDQHHL